MGSGLPGLLLWHVRRLAEPRCADPLTDRALIQRFAEGGDAMAFATLVCRHGPMVLQVCQHALGSEHDAEDAFQATFLVLARKASTLAWQESLAGWLHEVASRVAMKAKTAECRRRTHESLAGCTREPVADAPGSPPGTITTREAQALLNEELNRLPGRLRTPLVLCYLEGMTQDQAARQVGCSLSTLKRRLRRGLDILRQRLRRRGLAPAAVLSAALLGGGARATAALRDAATRAAVLFRAGLAVGEASRAAPLAEALLRQMAVARLRTAGALLIAAALVLGVGLAASRALRTGPGRGLERTESSSPPTTHQEPPARGHEEAAGPPRFGGPVQGVAFSPDGDLVAGCGGHPDGTLRLWDVKTGKQRWRYDLGCGARAVAYSTEGRVVAVAGDDRTVRLCDAGTGQELRRLRGHAESVTGLAFTPDRKSVISSSLDGTVRLWDRDTGAESRRFTTPGCAFHCLALSRDGKLLAAGAEELPGAGLRKPGEAALGVFLWELPSGKERPRLGYYPGGVQALAFTPDGRTLAAAGRSVIVVLWDVADGKRSLGEVHPFTVSGGRDGSPVKALAFGAGGRTLAYGFEKGVIHECDLASQTLRRRLVAFEPAADAPATRGILSLAFAPGGESLAAGGSDHFIHMWESSSGKQLSFGAVETSGRDTPQ
jgi:RNA polymerase sigma factor (sigma-70 family)